MTERAPSGRYDDLLSAAVREAESEGRAPNKIAPIKRLRDTTGINLVEAKSAVESYGHRHGVESLVRPAGAGAGTGLLIVACIVLAVAVMAGFILIRR